MKRSVIIGLVIIICIAGYIFGFLGLDKFINEIEGGGPIPNPPIESVIAGFFSLFILTIIAFFLKKTWQRVMQVIVLLAFLIFLFMFTEIFKF